MKSTVDILIGLWHFTWQVAMGIYPPFAGSNLWILCSVWRKTQKNGKILIFAQRMSAEKLNMHNKHIIKKSKTPIDSRTIFQITNIRNII